MELILKRLSDNNKSTIGHLFIDGEIYCATLEDTFRREKIASETRVPAGRYKILLRKGSPMSDRYQTKFGTNGMLWLQDVPGFEYIYLHIGNTDEDTAGCILVGSLIQQEITKGTIVQKVLNSTSIYIDLWAIVSPEIELQKDVFITILDE